MDRHGGERRADHLATTSSFHTDGGHHYHEFRQDHLHGAHHYHQPDHRHHHNLNGEQNASTGYHLNGSSNHSLPLSGQKRLLSHPNGIDCGGFVKLYVVGIPREATEQDISAVFGEYGHILEVVLLKDKRTGLQQECCFVKYATIEQAERAIGAFHSQYTFPGAVIPIKVKYADGERERLGDYLLYDNFTVLFVMIFLQCPSDVVLLDALGSIKFHATSHSIRLSAWRMQPSSNLKGALVRMSTSCYHEGLSECFCCQIFSPFGVIEEIFIVRDEFKQNRDPKKPRIGDSRPAPYLNDPSNGPMQSNEIQHVKSSHSGCKSATITSNGTTPVSHACDSVAEIEDTIECDWSEHVSPDGDLYYYNCITCESRWEKPEEYALYEQELDNFEDQQQQLQESKLHVLSSPEQWTRKKFCGEHFTGNGEIEGSALYLFGCPLNCILH
ncbi:UNVERIFIED_CONTAM: Flowering time control protein FCA [Sesamum angustifolium]|uniref:Flowering time control protein FCA n=1 Tax=Sesamum angustifolium TaxID=2727405 RepID=A0AAW2QUD9_9LAMI